MKTLKKISKGAAIVGLIAATSLANAAVINVDFSATNFVGADLTPPVDPVVGSYSFSHDGAADFTGLAINPTLLSVDLTINGFNQVPPP